VARWTWKKSEWPALHETGQRLGASSATLPIGPEHSTTSSQIYHEPLLCSSKTCKLLQMRELDPHAAIDSQVPSLQCHVPSTRWMFAIRVQFGLPPARLSNNLVYIALDNVCVSRTLASLGHRTVTLFLISLCHYSGSFPLCWSSICWRLVKTFPLSESPTPPGRRRWPSTH
jgi:hypothetical protein